MAQQNPHTELLEPLIKKTEDQPSPLSSIDWQIILEQLNDRKVQKNTASEKNDTHRHQDPLVAIAQTASGVNH